MTALDAAFIGIMLALGGIFLWSAWDAWKNPGRWS